MYSNCHSQESLSHPSNEKSAFSPTKFSKTITKSDLSLLVTNLNRFRATACSVNSKPVRANGKNKINATHRKLLSLNLDDELQTSDY